MVVADATEESQEGGPGKLSMMNGGSERGC